ncbi:glycosyltransferase family 4 protein [Burkholderia multivorans]|uniref:glycosyltransferase family 4 protein n=1 Tax=Burkholderia multivorans TaxID=87883 RepID=UPI001E4A4E9E|nr:glycosyltransferase family 4 protein [Burkholderia multivorans]MCA8141188.1 glycosyltransferase family 4 protein [Burkholderia multivorans]WVN03376.1 glycosyltransferase family 4 protein [Burkholderia multivorans]
MHQTRDWAAERRHPSPTALFSLPNAVYFLLKFRPDLASFEHQTVEGRMMLYFWWKAYGERDYPDFEWLLGDADIAYIRQLSVATLLDKFPRTVSFWLAGHAIGLLDDKALLDTLLENDLAIGATQASLPRFMRLLVESRADLHAHIDLATFSGQLACLSWWETHGQFEYPRLSWSSGSVWDRLNDLGSEEESQLISVPAFLELLVDSRNDLRASLDTKTFGGRLSALVWWNEHGRSEYPRLHWQTQPIIHRLNEIEPDEHGTLIDVPRFLAPLVDSRSDLRASLDTKTFGGRLSALLWWSEHGRFEYPRLHWQTQPIIHRLNEIESDEHGTLIDVPRFLAPLVDSRPDLREQFDLSTFTGRLNMLLWWNAHSKYAYPQLRWSTARIFDRLNKLDDGDTCGLFRVPAFLPRLVNSRPDLRSLFEIDTFRGRLDAMRWWARHGKREYPGLEWHFQDSIGDLMRTDKSVSSAIALPRFLVSIRQSRPDLVAAFDIATTHGAISLISWWQNYGKEEYPVLEQLTITLADDNTPPVVSIDGGMLRTLARPFGVNIVGFPQGILGLGEDARMAAQAMQLAGFDVALVNAPMSGPSRLDMSMNHLLRDDLAYQVSLFCLPPPEMVRLTLEGGRRLVESDTYRIGAWPWELPHWPSAFGPANAFVDEIWAQSRFVEAVYSRLGGRRVRHMPMAVVIPQPVAPDRQRFGLPEHQFLFYLMFDGNSWLTRKNPVAGVMAFKRAFAKDASGVGLVIKAMNVRDDDPTWRQVCELAAADDRIHVVSERLDRQDTIDFMASCDAYISLHRSEGFGRVIAEAMALGQPVVATNFSGNVDFCDEETSFLVDGELIPLRPGDYLFHEGQYWCDPDIGIAAEQIARVFGDANLRERIAQAGRARIERDYSTTAVARAYERRLSEIRQMVDGK